MKELNSQPQFFKIEPFDGESLSHFLGRFRRENHIVRPGALGKVAGIGTAISRWEKLFYNPPPKNEELEALASIVGLSIEQLSQMIGVDIRSNPIWLCSACYAEQPCHRAEWQSKFILKCERHNLQLLPACSECSQAFDIPALWQSGRCSNCFTSFAQMSDAEPVFNRQKSTHNWKL
jgi:hypothetical protein